MRAASLRLTESMDLCPECHRVAPGRVRAEAWVEVSVLGRWVGAYRLVPKGGKPVVAEVRLFPQDSQRRRSAGRWSGLPKDVPPGGLSGEAIRALRLKDPIGLFPQFVEDLNQRHPGAIDDVLKRLGISSAEGVVRRRPGRAGRPDLYYALWALRYVQLVEDGSRRPVADLAARPVMPIEGYASSLYEAPVQTVRDIIVTARRRGLLTKSSPGQAGGRLTPKANRCIRQWMRTPIRDGKFPKLEWWGPWLKG